MKEGTPEKIHLSDYKPSNYDIETVDLCFNLDEHKTRVICKSFFRYQAGEKEIFLNGNNLTLIDLKLNGAEYVYELSEEGLLLKDLPDQFELEIETELNPTENKTLSGLYKSGDIFCTQCEAVGFRRITYYLDRPDVMATFKTKVIANKGTYPTLLSNGNPIEKGDLEDGRHYVLWEDPFPKPCYLFALVAGDLGLVTDEFTTMSGRKIALEIYCDKGNEYKCSHAMESLKKSMKWDEEKFGLEYDLDIYMIVAVDSFNMGAMENKGLNIFNSQYVLADPKTATDNDFIGVESVIGHEYFHNWTGNRITCRDWFQLTLKEGLTVYRDQEFSADMNSRTVQRIDDVSRLRIMQFSEDAGPMAHPIRPDSYIEIDNFYTATIYEKGAEVIRMIETLLGKDGFRKGMDKYFELYDGQAVTTEDFLHAMSVANNNFDFGQFKKWYSQAGTPRVKASWKYDNDSKKVKLTLEQSCRATPGQETKEDFFIPLKSGFIQKNNLKEVSLLDHIKNKSDLYGENVLLLKEKKQTFEFSHIENEVIPSLNRHFGAPINLDAEYSDEELSLLMAGDSDFFNRFEACQSYARKILKEDHLNIPDTFYNAYAALLSDVDLDPSLKAGIIKLPAEELLHQDHALIDFEGIHKKRESFYRALALKFKDQLLATYENQKTDGEYKIDPLSIGKRSLANTCLGILATLNDNAIEELIWNHFNNASNMTDEFSALALLRQYSEQYSEKASAHFINKWKDETLVVNKWFAVEASTSKEEIFERLETLENHELYDKTVPNIFRSVWGAFSRNYPMFHHSSGKGYELIASRTLEIDRLNPQLAARVGGVFKDYSKLSTSNQALMKGQLDKILADKNISKNLFEIVSKIASSN